MIQNKHLVMLELEVKGMLAYKIDLMKALKEHGWNTTRLYNERPISQVTVQKIRKGKM